MINKKLSISLFSASFALVSALAVASSATPAHADLNSAGDKSDVATVALANQKHYYFDDGFKAGFQSVKGFATQYPTVGNKGNYDDGYSLGQFVATAVVTFNYQDYTKAFSQPNVQANVHAYHLAFQGYEDGLNNPNRKAKIVDFPSTADACTYQYAYKAGQVKGQLFAKMYTKSYKAGFKAGLKAKTVGTIKYPKNVKKSYYKTGYDVATSLQDGMSFAKHHSKTTPRLLDDVNFYLGYSGYNAGYKWVSHNPHKSPNLTGKDPRYKHAYYQAITDFANTMSKTAKKHAIKDFKNHKAMSLTYAETHYPVGYLQVYYDTFMSYGKKHAPKYVVVKRNIRAHKYTDFTKKNVTKHFKKHSKIKVSGVNFDEHGYGRYKVGKLGYITMSSYYVK